LVQSGRNKASIVHVINHFPLLSHHAVSCLDARKSLQWQPGNLNPLRNFPSPPPPPSALPRPETPTRTSSSVHCRRIVRGAGQEIFPRVPSLFRPSLRLSFPLLPFSFTSLTWARPPPLVLAPAALTPQVYLLFFLYLHHPGSYYRDNCRFDSIPSRSLRCLQWDGREAGLEEWERV
jgi:hypothetical protein